MESNGCVLDSVKGSELSHQGLRTLSILMPLTAYLGPFKRVGKIGAVINSVYRAIYWGI